MVKNLGGRGYGFKSPLHVSLRRLRGCWDHSPAVVSGFYSKVFNTLLTFCILFIHSNTQYRIGKNSHYGEKKESSKIQISIEVKGDEFKNVLVKSVCCKRFFPFAFHYCVASGTEIQLF